MLSNTKVRQMGKYRCFTGLLPLIATADHRTTLSIPKRFRKRNWSCAVRKISKCWWEGYLFRARWKGCLWMPVKQVTAGLAGETRTLRLCLLRDKWQWVRWIAAERPLAVAVIAAAARTADDLACSRQSGRRTVTVWPEVPLCTVRNSRSLISCGYCFGAERCWLAGYHQHHQQYRQYHTIHTCIIVFLAELAAEWLRPGANRLQFHFGFGLRCLSVLLQRLM